MTKTLFTAILAVTTLAAGCAKLPVAVKVQQEPERVVKVNRAKPQTAPTARAVDPFRVDHGLPIIASGSGGATAAEKPAEKLAEKARVEVVERPSTTFRLLPAIEASEAGDRIVGAMFSPAKPKASWTLKATQGSPVIGKVKFDLSAEQSATESFEATPKQLGWPVRLDGTQTVEVPLDSENVLTYLQAHMEAKSLTLGLTLEDADGETVLTPKDQPLSLAVKVDVL
jgi:hypothetical protein